MTGSGDLRIYADQAQLAQGLADYFAESARAAVSERGAFRVALSGGNTPRPAYELLGREPLRSRIPWNDTFIYFGDERCVPPTDDRSNYAMVAKAFLDAIGLPPQNVHRIRGEVDPGIAANEYASLLRTDLGGAPHFDLVLLGVGEDGHTASLFPGASPETDDRTLVHAVQAPSGDMWRVTITPRVINLARAVAFAVAGAQKSRVLAEVIEGPRDSARLPAQSVRPASGKLLWFIDEAAAADLAERPSPQRLA
ncbi:MAG: 6-phosphogluconolactonase [Candidatus Eremiobacteraeota bacterium]|nr:6-phosphogluconolactonase [Candidatus Eremiobacteraeota bacterium]